MEYFYAPDNLSLGQMAACWVAREILACPNQVLGLPTGRTYEHRGSLEHSTTLR